MVVTLRKGTFKHVEAELYDYHDTLKRIKLRREELTTNGPKETTQLHFNYGERIEYNSPTERYATRLATDVQLAEMERVARAVEHVYNSCDPDRKKLIRIKYWTKPQMLSWEGISTELNVSRATAFRWRDEIVQALAEKLGWY